VILFCGGNVDPGLWFDQVPVLLHAWYPGQEGGRALAQVLDGEINPSAKLPVTFGKTFDDYPAAIYYPSRDDGKSVHYDEGIFVGYRGFDHFGIEPRFPFGFGLSYTNFEYSDLVVDPSAATVEAPVHVKCQIRNTGDRPGAEIAQLYVRPLEPKIERPIRELKGFAKVFMNAGEQKEVSFLLDPKAFQYFDPATHRFRIDTGRYEIGVGSSSRNLNLAQSIELKKGSDVTD
jgi:beta-glucosidase